MKYVKDYMKREGIGDKENYFYHLMENFYNCIELFISIYGQEDLLKKHKESDIEKIYRYFQSMDDKIVISRRSEKIFKYLTSFVYVDVAEKIIGKQGNITVGTIKKILRYDPSGEKNEEFQVDESVMISNRNQINEFKKYIKDKLIPLIVYDYEKEVELTNEEKEILKDIFKNENKSLEFLSNKNFTYEGLKYNLDYYDKINNLNLTLKNGREDNLKIDGRMVKEIKEIKERLIPKIEKRLPEDKLELDSNEMEELHEIFSDLSLENVFKDYIDNYEKHTLGNIIDFMQRDFDGLYYNVLEDDLEEFKTNIRKCKEYIIEYFCEKVRLRLGRGMPQEEIELCYEEFCKLGDLWIVPEKYRIIFGGF